MTLLSWLLLLFLGLGAVRGICRVWREVFA